MSRHSSNPHHTSATRPSGPKLPPLHKAYSSFENAVRQMLISSIVSERQNVCDLLCGRGSDTLSYVNARIRKYIGFDPNKEDLKAAHSKWVEALQALKLEHKSYSPSFHHINSDPFLHDLSRKLKLDSTSTSSLFNVVSCQGRMLTQFSQAPKVVRFMENVVSILVDGGYFIGYIPDPDVIVSRLAQQGLTLHTLTCPYTLYFENNTWMGAQGPRPEGKTASIYITIDLKERKNEPVDCFDENSLTTASAYLASSDATKSTSIIGNSTIARINLDATSSYLLTIAYKNENNVVVSTTHTFLTWEELSAIFTSAPVSGSLQFESKANALDFFYENAFGLGSSLASLGKYFLDSENMMEPDVAALARTFAVFVSRCSKKTAMVDS